MPLFLDHGEYQLPRQEPGRNFAGIVVPVPPQTHLKIAEPMVIVPLLEFCGIDRKSVV